MLGLGMILEKNETNNIFLLNAYKLCIDFKRMVIKMILILLVLSFKDIVTQ